MFRRQGKVAGMVMEIISYKYNDRQLVADKNIDEVLERTWSRLGSNVTRNELITKLISDYFDIFEIRVNYMAWKRVRN